MAGLLPGDPSHHGMVESGPYNFSHDKLEELDHSSSNWYLSRKDIEENSPSRKDGIDLKKETYFRKSYCTFLQDLGMRLKVPQVTIATAIIFCHRFFLRQSHAKNDRRIIATVCMFLAGKVEETPRPLKDVILVSYEMINKKDPAAVQRIKQKEVYEQQKELILLGERVVLSTLGFDLNVHHPYKPLVEAIKKFKVAQNALAQVAWNFVNDGLRTSLCLQFKPHHIAAGAIFLAAKFLKVKLPSDGEKVWWQEFDVTPRQLEEVSNQMLELYEQNRTAPPPSNGSSGEGFNHHRGAMVKTPAGVDPVSINSYSPAVGAATLKQGGPIVSSVRTGPDQSSTDNHQSVPQRSIQNQSNDYGSTETRSDYKVLDGSGGSRDRRHHEPDQFPCSSSQENIAEASNRSKNVTSSDSERNEATVETREWKDEGLSHKSSGNMGGQSSSYGEGLKGYCPPDAIRKIDKEKFKAALEKRRKFRADVTRKADFMDEYDIIERELESGVELAAEDEKVRQERRQSWSNNKQQPLYRLEPEKAAPNLGKVHGDVGGGDKNFLPIKQQSSGSDGGGRVRSASVESEEMVHGSEPDGLENAEEGELSFDPPRELHSPKSSSRKRRAAASPIKQHDFQQHPHPPVATYHHRSHQIAEEGRVDRVERDHRRHRQGNHI
ncbi:cyclin-T1-3-like isoform X2 [Magnolia sinica]|uniref:cyclin-T1-3-like isoform X2 n=1 Tax=Magnolia sinica TaxID=86752 RepID=UPI00265AD6E3|nr:cyclin-T1-3-like isoform X2 [Magnolia sinica]XP_058108820.1 cyclin-T1-3-like isoform X2 [Magnolia sinica]